MFSPVTKGALSWIEVSSLAAIDSITHAFCTRLGGVSSGAYAGLNMSPSTGDLPENIEENWQVLSGALGAGRDRFIVPSQVHGDGIVVLGRSEDMASDPHPSCDALVTDRPGLALCIRTADCVPLFLVSPEKRVIANIHAGWRGTALNIVSKVAEVMTRRFGADPARIVAAIGPAIGACCYEVDEPVIRAMEPWCNEPGVCRPSQAKARWMLDLQAVNRCQMIDSGIPTANISIVSLCTSCHQELFFSHRRDNGITGRQVSVLMLKT